MKELSRSFPKAAQRLFIWLSGADHKLLNECPRYERLKYGAFGASVLIPTIFGAIAACYAVSTLTNNSLIIYGFAAVWGFIILTIDRLLLSTYRAFASKGLRKAQFFLRTTIAVLMGFTISHPLTLLLFEDTIASEIEQQRVQDVAKLQGSADELRTSINERADNANLKLAELHKDYQSIVAGSFLKTPSQTAGIKPTRSASFNEFDQQIESYQKERDTVRSELDKWQAIYESEITGKRTGIAGIGPNARAIEANELAWRRAELGRLNQAITSLNSQKNKLTSKLAENSLETEIALAGQYAKLEQQSISLFSSQQDELLAGVNQQIALVSDQVKSTTQELVQFDTLLNERADSIRAEERSGLMYQSLALHDLFKNKASGGTFALAVYIILIGLFVVIDTIPLVVKFFSEPGVYDKKLCHDESLVFDTPFCEAVASRQDVIYQIENHKPGSVAAEEQVEKLIVEPVTTIPDVAAAESAEAEPLEEKRRRREQVKIAKKRALKDRLKSYHTTDRNVSIEMEHDNASHELSITEAATS